MTERDYDEDATHTLRALLDDMTPAPPTPPRPAPEGGERWAEASHAYAAALQALQAAAEALPLLPPKGLCCDAPELFVTMIGDVEMRKVYEVDTSGMLVDTEHWVEVDGFGKVECDNCGGLFRGLWSAGDR